MRRAPGFPPTSRELSALFPTEAIVLAVATKGKVVGRRDTTRWGVVGVAILVIGVALATSSAGSTQGAGAGQITRFDSGLSSVRPEDDVAVGPDGNVWFTDAHGHQLGEITPTGVVSFVPVGPASNPVSITSGPDGNLWFIDYSADGPDLGRLQLTPYGKQMTEWQIADDRLPDNVEAIRDLVTGADGHVYALFHEPYGSGLIQADVNGHFPGVFTSRFGGAYAAEEHLIGLGPDGRIYGTSDQYDDKNGTLGLLWALDTTFPTRFPSSDDIVVSNAFRATVPYGVAAGSDGRLWLAERHPAGLQSLEASTPVHADQARTFGLPAGATPLAIVTGPDGALWFSEETQNTIGKVDPESDSPADLFDLPGDGHAGRPVGGEDGNIWFADNGWVGRVSTGIAAPTSGNLLRNPGFEQGIPPADASGYAPVPGWATTGTFTIARYNTPGFPTHLYASYYSGGSNLAWGGPGSILSHAFQYVDVTAGQQGIDARRAAVTLSGHLGGRPPYAAQATVTATFLGGDGTSLGSVQIGPVSGSDLGNGTGLVSETQTALVPPGTRGVRVDAAAVDDPGTTGQDNAFFDNLSLTLSVRPASQIVVPADRTPPVVQAVVVSPAAFPAAGSSLVRTGGHSVGAGGATITVTVSEPAHLVLTFERATRIANCPSPAASPSCTRYQPVGKPLAMDVQGGTTRTSFDGRLSGRALDPGRYRLSVLATDRAGNTAAAAATTTFTITEGA
jgi:virginiamycin B lyase